MKSRNFVLLAEQALDHFFTQWRRQLKNTRVRRVDVVGLMFIFKPKMRNPWNSICNNGRFQIFQWHTRKPEVLIEKEAKKGQMKAPLQVKQKFSVWVDLVESKGLRLVRTIPGFHDELLKGKRKGQRSIRLNRSWMAIYKTTEIGPLILVLIEEITKHED